MTAVLAPNDLEQGTTSGGAPVARWIASGLIAGVAFVSPLTTTTAQGAVPDVVIQHTGNATSNGGYTSEPPTPASGPAPLRLLHSIS